MTTHSSTSATSSGASAQPLERRRHRGSCGQGSVTHTMRSTHSTTGRAAPG